MDWQQLAALVIVAVAAGLLLRWQGLVRHRNERIGEGVVVKRRVGLKIVGWGEVAGVPVRPRLLQGNAEQRHAPHLVAHDLQEVVDVRPLLDVVREVEVSVVHDVSRRRRGLRGDLPQAIDAAGNNNAAAMLQRDVANITAYFGRFAPEILATDYGREIWKLYATGELSPETVLTGRFVQSSMPADVHGVMRDVESARRWHERNM